MIPDDGIVEADWSALEEAAECLRTLAHPHRLRMVQILLEKEHTVGQLAEACSIRSHVASEHLRRMKDRGLLASRRDGQRTWYRVQELGVAGIIRCVEARYQVGSDCEAPEVENEA